MTQALILVDIQNDYFPAGSMELVGMIQAAENARKVLDSFRDKDEPIFHIQHLSIRPGATFFVPGTTGANHHTLVEPANSERIVEKNFPNSFRDTNLEEQLHAENVQDLVIVGAMSHMCIDATTRAAFDMGFRCTVVDDACATRDLEYKNATVAAADVHAAFMAALAAPYANIVTTDSYLNA